MRFTPLDKQQRADWQAMLGCADPARIGAAAAMFFLSALALPLCKFEAVAGLYLLYATVLYYMLTHSLAALLAVAAPGIVLFGVSALAPALPHPFLMPAVYTALVVGGVGGAFLLLHCREKKYLPLLLLPIAAYAIAGAVAGPYLGLLVLIPAALALVLGHGMLTCRPQTPVLVTLSLVLAASGVIAFLVRCGLYGRLAGNPFTYLAEITQSGIASVYRTALDVYAAEGIVMPLSDTDVYNLSVMVANILPGLFFAGCGVLSFVIYRVYLRVLVAWGTLKRVPLRVGAMTVSPLAAALFLLSLTASAMAGMGLFGTVCENFALVLEAPLVLVGVTSLLGRGAQKRSTLSLLLLIGLAALLFNYPTLALNAAAIWGALRILLAAVLNLREGKNEKK